MAPDEIMVYGGMAIVPLFTGIVAAVVLRAVHLESMSKLLASLLFFVSLVAGVALSFGFVYLNSDLLHGDGALAIVAAPVTGAIVSIPIAIIFAMVLCIMAWSRHPPDLN